MRERKPTLTRRVLQGIVAATSEILAGDLGDNPDVAKIKQADQWARKMLEWKDGLADEKATISQRG